MEITRNALIKKAKENLKIASKTKCKKCGQLPVTRPAIIPAFLFGEGLGLATCCDGDYSLAAWISENALA